MLIKVCKYCIALTLSLNQMVISGQVVVPTDFPNIIVEQNGEVASGYLFLSVSADEEGVGYYLMVVDNEGNPVMYRKLADDYAYDFKMQPNGMLSYAQFISHHSYTGGGNCYHVLLDQEMNVMDSIQMKNGYIAEAHDFQLLPNGHVLMIGYYMTQVDLSERVDGGYPDAKVSGGIIQELDDDGKVIFQWRSWDHFDIEAYNFGGRANQQEVSAFHLNTINLDVDGNILLATPSWVKKISRQTGEILWTLGGKENAYSFVGVDSLAGADQVTGHAFHHLENGNYLVYNNGGRMYEQSTSSVHEFRLDQANMIAEHVWSYYPESDIPAWHRGNAQRLSNGNTLIGWGGASGAPIPICTEVDSTGMVVQEVSISNNRVESYRAFRFSLGIKPFAIDSVLNRVTTAYYHLAPLNPRFVGKDPLILPAYLMVCANNEAFKGAFFIDASQFQIPDPSIVTIYSREAGANDFFQPLTTDFEPAEGVFSAELSINLSDSIELIFGYPDIESLAITPTCRNPENLSKIHREVPIKLEWSPEGFFTRFALQIAADSIFESLLFESDSIMSTVFEYLPPANMTYYWRVRTYSDGYHDQLESSWSDPCSFTVTNGYLKLLLPNGNEKWLQDESYFIQWEDNTEEDLTIELYYNHQLVDRLAVTESDGAWKWRVPESLEPGCLYEIKIYSSEHLELKDESSGYFSIVDSMGFDLCNVSIADHETDPMFFVSSIPELDQIRVTFFTERTEKVQIKIFNIFGQCIYTGERKICNPGTYSEDIPIERVPNQLLIISTSIGDLAVNLKYIQ